MTEQFFFEAPDFIQYWVIIILVFFFIIPRKKKNKYEGKNEIDIYNIKLYDNSQRLILTIVKNQIFKKDLNAPILKSKSDYELNKIHYSHDVQNAFEAFIKNVENYFCYWKRTKEESLIFSDKNGKNIENLRLAIIKNTNFNESEFENGIYKN